MFVTLIIALRHCAIIALWHCAVAQCVNSYRNTTYSNPCCTN